MPYRFNPFTGNFDYYASGLQNVVEDTTPQLGGDLDVNGKFINGSLISDTDSTDNLGSTSRYWANSYVDRLYLNSTAYIDGASAGLLRFTGNLWAASSSRIIMNSNRIQLTTSGSSHHYIEYSATPDGPDIQGFGGGRLLSQTNEILRWTSAGVQPGADSTYDLGTSALYFAETYTDRLYLNSTAYLDGATAGTAQLVGTLDTTSGRIKNTTRVTTTYTILVTDSVIFANTDSAGYTVTLPAGAEGQTYKVINSGSSGNTLTLAPNGSEHLVGVNSNSTLADSEALQITYNSTDGWY